MSAQITNPISTHFIDLTDDSPTPSPKLSPRVTVPNQRTKPAAHEELQPPPSKRPRLEKSQPRLRRRSLKSCLRDQILPHVARAVQGLSHDQYNVSDLAQNIIITIAKGALFRRRLDETGGHLSIEDEAELAKQASLLVQKCCRDLKYQIPPPESREEAPNPPQPLVTDVPNHETHHHPESISKIWPPAQPTLPSRYRRKEQRPFRPFERDSRWQAAQVKSDNPWFQQKQRPYRASKERDLIRKGVAHLREVPAEVAKGPIVYHVDFTADEIAEVVTFINKCVPQPAPRTLESLKQFLEQQCPVVTLVNGRLEGRGDEDLQNFCSDILAGKTSTTPRVLSLTQEDIRRRPATLSKDRGKMASLLFARELEGPMGFGRTRTYMNFQNEAKIIQEDDLDVISEFTNCAGDITTVSWVSDGALVCGTTVHSDPHNQQYNKPGNLLLYSLEQGNLRSFPDHRIPRPLVEQGQNSSLEMRRSQDPWLYSSVVSSDFDHVHQRAYTSSFDKTVKVWETDKQGNRMKCITTWYHDGNVNFVAAAKDGSGRVATAADVPSHAVRVYTVDPNNTSQSPYCSFSCSRIDAEDNPKWAYYPATMQWGRATGTSHLLAVGYSPRSVIGDDNDIPEDKTNTGEITVWDADAGRRIPVMTASTANVFEVCWHPTLARFIAATSPCGLSTEPGTKTQIHMFQRDRDRIEPAYSEYQSLDCPAYDINELTFVPNSLWHAYVTAGCTDGKVYVWDTAQSDDPIHVLSHGVSLEGFEQEHMETLDMGVKFTAWGTTNDRFYTGASDGVVKVWNVRNRRPFIRTLLEAPAPIASGAFSPDMTKLAIGDASGRLFVFAIDQRDAHESHYMALPGMKTKIRRPMMFVSHSEPPPPSQNVEMGEGDTQAVESDDTILGITASRAYLRSEQLVYSGNPVIGVSQGPNYQETGLFLGEAHEDQDSTRPLLWHYARQQQESLEEDCGKRPRSRTRLKDPGAPTQELKMLHENNSSWAKNIELLAEDDIDELRGDGAILEDEDVDYDSDG